MASSSAGEDPATAAGRKPDLDAAAAMFRTLGMTRRLQVMQLFVHVSGTLCGCEIADILELEDYQVSRDLAALRKAGLVESRERTGTWIHHQAASDPDPIVTRVLEVLRALPLERDVDSRLSMRLAFRERAGCVLGVGDPDVLAALDRATESSVLSVLD
ncbi:MAG: ArsR family transcriptional regulator [Nitriliruptoraceae bacterium]